MIAPKLRRAGAAAAAAREAAAWAGRERSADGTARRERPFSRRQLSRRHIFGRRVSCAARACGRGESHRLVWVGAIRQSGNQAIRQSGNQAHLRLKRTIDWMFCSGKKESTNRQSSTVPPIRLSVRSSQKLDLGRACGTSAGQSFAVGMRTMLWGVGCCGDYAVETMLWRLRCGEYAVGSMLWGVCCGEHAVGSMLGRGEGAWRARVRGARGRRGGRRLREGGRQHVCAGGGRARGVRAWEAARAPRAAAAVDVAQQHAAKRRLGALSDVAEADGTCGKPKRGNRSEGELEGERRAQEAAGAGLGARRS
eukprot:2769355-Prymnesium_polylepis.1